MRVLVTGGAGYIGSHTVVQLVAAGHEVVVVDNFANAKPRSSGRVEAMTGQPLRRAVVRPHRPRQDRAPLRTSPLDAVIHFAGLKAVGESVEQPLEYYENNLGSTFSLVRRDAPARRLDARLLLLGHGLRRRRAGADDRGPADLGDQPLRLDQGDASSRSCATSPPPTRTGGSPCCATSTRSAPTPPARIGEDPADIPNRL